MDNAKDFNSLCEWAIEHKYSLKSRYPKNSHRLQTWMLQARVPANARVGGQQGKCIMRRDKKAQAGKLRFILPRRLGEVALFDDIPEPLVTDSLKENS